MPATSPSQLAQSERNFQTPGPTSRTTSVPSQSLPAPAPSRQIPIGIARTRKVYGLVERQAAASACPTSACLRATRAISPARMLKRASAARRNGSRCQMWASLPRVPGTGPGPKRSWPNLKLENTRGTAGQTPTQELVSEPDCPSRSSTERVISRAIAKSPAEARPATTFNTHRLSPSSSASSVSWVAAWMASIASANRPAFSWLSTIILISSPRGY